MKDISDFDMLLLIMLWLVCLHSSLNAHAKRSPTMLQNQFPASPEHPVNVSKEYESAVVFMQLSKPGPTYCTLELAGCLRFMWLRLQRVV